MSLGTVLICPSRLITNIHWPFCLDLKIKYLEFLFLKTVEDELDAQMIQEFLEEALMMKNFNHPNVLSLIGISIHEEKPCALIPLMSNGDLKTFLRNHTVSVQHIGIRILNDLQDNSRSVMY